MKKKINRNPSIFMREWGEEKRGYVGMSKEDRLKSVCKRYIYIAFEFGKVIGSCLPGKKSKRTAEALEYLFWKRISGESTRAFKKAGVLPLKKAA